MILGTDAAGVTADGREVVVHGVIAASGPTSRASLLSERYDGTLAEQVAVPTWNLVDKPAELSLRRGRVPADRLAHRLPDALRDGPRDARAARARAGRRRRAGHRGDPARARRPGLEVIVTGRDEERRARALSLGAAAAVEPGARVPRVDVVLETVGKATWSHSVRSVKPGGTIVVAGATSGDAAPAELTRIFFQEITVAGTTMGSRDDLEHLLAFLARTGVRPLVDSTFPLAEARAALSRLCGGDADRQDRARGRRVTWEPRRPRPGLPGADARAAARRRGRRSSRPWCGTRRRRPSRCGRRARSSTSTAGRTTSSRRGSPSTGTRAAPRSTRSTCASTAAACARARRPGYIDDLRHVRRGARGVARRHPRRARRARAAHDHGPLDRRARSRRCGRTGTPATVSGLVLNSPWLELQGSSVLRHLSGPGRRADRPVPAQGAAAQHRPRLLRPHPRRGVAAASGRTTPTWRPTPSFPVRAGWLRAITIGHARVARGLSIESPILMLCSSRTIISPRWSEDMRAADVVLDVELLARRAVQLGSHVTVVRMHDGLHDLSLSPRPVRDAVLRGDRPVGRPRTAGAEVRSTQGG